MNRFCHYELRTTDVEVARTFYSELLGAGFWAEGVGIGALPGQAAARGAPPHWLGHIAVNDVVETTLRLVQQSLAVIREYIAARHPEEAERLTDFVCTTMAGLSAKARNGHGLDRLLTTAHLAGLAIAHVLSRVKGAPSGARPSHPAITHPPKQ
jgi:catechol 2,3-dioxygenase-like lactoylglutathione lyase family enzyme